MDKTGEFTIYGPDTSIIPPRFVTDHEYRKWDVSVRVWLGARSFELHFSHKVHTEHYTVKVEAAGDEVIYICSKRVQHTHGVDCGFDELPAHIQDWAIEHFRWVAEMLTAGMKVLKDNLPYYVVQRGDGRFLRMNGGRYTGWVSSENLITKFSGQTDAEKHARRFGGTAKPWPLEPEKGESDGD